MLKDFKLTLIGVHFFIIAAVAYICAVGASLFALVASPNPHLFIHSAWYVSVVSFGIFLILSIINVLFIKPSPAPKELVLGREPENSSIFVGMTAYNDELSISDAVADFSSQPNVSEVMVVDNNCTDRTADLAREAGARVVHEPIQGYGASCRRILWEGTASGCGLICLVEGDGTFSGDDLKKFAAYAENADLVIGTRTTRELTADDSQMNYLLHWGNVFVAKLLQARFWKTRFTDMGCTFRLIRADACGKIIDQLTVTDNAFLCEMMVVAGKNRLKIIEIPITFRKRIGESKGVGDNFFKAAKTAFEMWAMILFK